jgi:hypothetical protein
LWEIREVKKGEATMNNYEASTVFEIGEAREVILGVKPIGGVDNEGSLTRYLQPDDIEESEE